MVTIVRFIVYIFTTIHTYIQAKLNVIQSIQRFLKKYGFRCINELKLEEHTLHDDPSFVIDTIAGWWFTLRGQLINFNYGSIPSMLTPGW